MVPIHKAEKKDRKEIIEWLLESIEEIDQDESLTRSVKTKKLTRLASTVMHQLRGGIAGQGLKEKNAIAESTFIRYLTEARRAVILKNWKHHSLKSNIDRLIAKYPEYKTALNKLKRFKVSNGVNHLQALTKEIEKENPEAYAAFLELQVGHEILRHLHCNEELARRDSQYKETVKERHNNPIQVNYYYIKWLIEDLLTKKTHKVEGVESYAYRRLALGIALATGRRAIEVLAPWQGHFTPYGEYTLNFSGAAKKKEKAVNKAIIYTIVPAKMVLTAIWHLRRVPEVALLKEFEKDSDRNTKVNVRMAKSLNELAKTVFNSPEAVFKDSRNIYGKMVLHEHYESWFKENGGTQDAFLQAMFMHEHIETQLIYKALILDFDSDEGLRYTEAGVQQLADKRIELLSQFDGHAELQRKNINALHSAVKAKIEEKPDFKLNPSSLNKQLGFNKQMAKRYLGIIGDEVNEVVDEL
ncbi:protelomerase family protein [Spartinivicinus poritis]|uniref:Protelomerase family protein n=1 Tax=Spartinivicinus poritis TaxID=2994640 RepID=A0ABT5UIG5_9GAMM|nr:protelomerase family protein [Spartinivicinus sp. A2-2]MDE1466005.1 protelomerase family protein [Spartinivicinus sp. A2-2]